MRVMIFSDMEGVAGITRWQQVTGGEEHYREGRVLYTEEINAAVRGARAAGASEIIVLDCHGAGGDWSFNSLIPDLLDPGCEFVVQGEWTEYVEPLEQGCDAALFVGMHAMAGAADGGLNHTVSATNWHALRFNGSEVGETGINAALCGTWGCPVVLVTGDRAACREASALLGEGLVTVEVKQSIGRYSARHKTPARARELIEAGAREALERRASAAPYDPGSPCEITVDFQTSDQAEAYGYRHGVAVTGSRQVVSRAERFWDAWRQLYP